MERIALKLVSLTLAGSLLGVGASAQVEPKLKPDFTNVVNLGAAKSALALKPAHWDALRKQLFVVTPGGDGQPYPIYGTNDYANFSSLITTDNVLQLYHVFFDSTLRHAEEKHLLPELVRLTGLMLTQSETRYQSVKQTRLASAALKNIAYFGVADRLLGGKGPLPREAAFVVSRELANINAGNGFEASAIFPYQIDFSQFRVRGHYSRSPELGRYFRALMWFGLTPISLEKHVNGRQELFPEQIRQAGLMVQDLYECPALPSWRKIYSVTSLYVGDSNGLTPPEWMTSLHQVLGSPLQPLKLADDGVLRKLVASVTRPRLDSAGSDIQFHFMGQRSIPDGVVFKELTHNLRPWPSPLDVAAVLGSARAGEILDAQPGVYNPNGWSAYGAKRTKLQREFAGWTDTDWDKNLYNGSLDLIRLNLAAPTANQPAVMHESAWADKSISSSLAFWAELRHDTVLYGLQEASESGDGDDQPFVKGYVEPNVPLYAKLSRLLHQMESGLAAFKYLNIDEINHFHEFEQLVDFFESVSRRELAGGRLTKEEHWKIRKVEGDLSLLDTTIQLIGETYNMLNEDDQDMAVVADVHTVKNVVLEVASGHADDLIAIVPIEGQLYLARGSVLSFYVFDIPSNKRMTDHEWKHLLQTSEGPPRPDWIYSYFVPLPSRRKDQ